MRVSFAAAIALNEAIHLTKASQIFDAAIESRRVLISGNAADSKKDLARRIAQILACQELSVEAAKDIPHHAIKTAGIVKDIEALQALFEPVSDEPEAEQDHPIILIVDIALVEQRDLIKTLRSRGKTPIVVAIGKENEVSAECAEIFQYVLATFSFLKQGPLKHTASYKLSYDIAAGRVYSISEEDSFNCLEPKCCSIEFNLLSFLALFKWSAGELI